MKTIAENEKEKYSDIWSLEEYSNDSPGQQMVDMFCSIVRPKPGSFIVDVGAGSGAGSRALVKKGMRVAAFDLTDKAWKADPNITFRTGTIWNGIPMSNLFDYAYCCDMMEHLPTQFVALSVEQILRVAGGAFFSISFSPDNFGHYIQKDLHLTVQPFTWWRDTLRELGDLEEARDLIGEGVFYVRGR